VDNPVLLEDLELMRRVAGRRDHRNYRLRGLLGYYFTQYFVRDAKALGIHEVIGLCPLTHR
jgi:hypothetical protein